MNTLKVFFGEAVASSLKNGICGELSIDPGKVDLEWFSDGEPDVQYRDNIRGTNTFIVQSTYSLGKNPWPLLQLLVMIDAARRASAKSITAVIPYFGFARQDRKDKPRKPITAKLVADLITTAGANRVLTMDLHAPQIQGFFNIPVDHLYGAIIFLPLLKEKRITKLSVVSPDHGGIPIARAYARRLGRTPLVVIDKQRPKPNHPAIINIKISGRIRERNMLIVDDLMDTGGTLELASKELKKRGAGDIYIACTHALLSGSAVERLKNSPVLEIHTTDTIPIDPEKRVPNLIINPVGKLFGQAIRQIHEEKSVSILFEDFERAKIE